MMFLFYFTALPVFSLFSFWVYASDRRKLKIQYKPFLKGLLWFIPAGLCFFIFYKPDPGSFRSNVLFVYYFFSEHLLSLGLALTGYFLFHGFFHTHKSDDRFVQSLAFLTGFYLLTTILYYIKHFGDFDFYLLFIIPILRCVTILLSALFIDKICNGFGKIKILYGAAILCIPAVLSLLSILYALNHIFLGFSLSLILLGLSVLLCFFIKDL